MTDNAADVAHYSTDAVVSSTTDDTHTPFISSESGDARYYVNENWIEYLANLLKIGRLCFGLNRDACDYYVRSFPKFECHSEIRLNEMLVDAMCGIDADFSETVTIMDTLLSSSNLYTMITVNDRQIYALYRNALASIRDEGNRRFARIEFERMFDVKSSEIIDAAVDCEDDSLRESPALTLAKWCRAIPTSVGNLRLYGTNVIYKKNNNDNSSSLLSLLPKHLLNIVKRYFHVVENTETDDITLNYRDDHDNTDVHIILSSIPANWIFDGDVVYNFINIITEPYPFDTLTNFHRICISMYFNKTDTITSTMKTSRQQIPFKSNDYGLDIILSMLTDIPDTWKISHFTNFPLIPYNNNILLEHFPKYAFHNFIRQYASNVNRYNTRIDFTMHDMIKLMNVEQCDTVFLINRPILSNVVDAIGNDLFVDYWSPDDSIEIHTNVRMERFDSTSNHTSNKMLMADIRSTNNIKALSFKIKNGFIVKRLTTFERDPRFLSTCVNEMFDKYSSLLHLWIPAYRIIGDERYIIKSWTENEQHLIEQYGQEYYARTYGNIGDVVREAVADIKNVYAINNTFAGKMNLVNVYDIDNPDIVFTLIFDYPINFYDCRTNDHIDGDLCNDRNLIENFKSIPSIQIAENIIGGDIREENLLSISENDKYILRLDAIPAVVLIGSNWNSRDAIKVTELLNRDISRNVVHVIQSVLCNDIIKSCVLGQR